VRGAATVADPSSTPSSPPIPELNLDAAAIRAGEKNGRPPTSGVRTSCSRRRKPHGATECHVYRCPAAGAFKMVADPAQVNWTKVIAILTVLVIYVTMVYGPIAAMLVEMFPTRIRYTGMSLPYHIGNGWFGGLLPATAFAMSAATGRYLLRPLVPDRLKITLSRRITLVIGMPVCSWSR
jgi:hypothetical protein